MTRNVLLTTGQTVGATNVPEPTLRRYVLAYKDHFSEGARISSRGRRFTPRDVETVMFIRGLHARGLSQAEVSEALKKGDWNPRYMGRRDVADAVRVVAQANDLIDKSQQHLTMSKLIVSEVKSRQDAQSVLASELARRVENLERFASSFADQKYPGEVTVLSVAGAVLAWGMTLVLVGFWGPGWFPGALAVVGLLAAAYAWLSFFGLMFV